MKKYVKIVLGLVAAGLMSAGGSGVAVAEAPQHHVVGTDEIQARIDGQVSQDDADREAIRTLLQREEVRRMASTAGLDLERAGAAVTVLSGSALEQAAAQARELNGDLVGGDSKVILSTTAIIIILLILILLLS